MKRSVHIVIAFVLVLLFTSQSYPQSTEFTYQGSLVNSGTPATGNFDFEFALYDAAASGTQVGSTLTRSSVAVAGGTFVVSLDFGATVFPGANRYLEVRVRAAGSGGYTSLSPRSQIKSAPYAIRALTVTGPVTGADPVATLKVTNAQPGVDPDLGNLPPAGLRAEATATNQTNAGVMGISNGQTGLGILGLATGSGFSRATEANGVVGVATSTTGYTVGVAGDVSSPDGVAFSANAQDTAGTTSLLFQGYSEAYPVNNQIRFSVKSNGDVYAAGTLVVGGSKSSLAKLPNGRSVLLYAVESPENWFEDFGTLRLRNGRAVVKIDKTFAQTTNVTIPYKVFLTPNGRCRGLYVIRKTADSFEVREIGGGRSNVEFDFRIVARRIGYENVRFAPAQLPPTSKK